MKAVADSAVAISTGHSPGRGGKPGVEKAVMVATEYHEQTPSSLASSAFESDPDTVFVASAPHEKQNQSSQPPPGLPQDPSVHKTDSMLLDEIFQQVGLEVSLDPFTNSDDD